MSPEGHERIEKQEQTSPNIRQDLRRSMALDACHFFPADSLHVNVGP